MKQELYIKGEVVSLTLEEFVSGFNSGTVWMSKKKGKYTLWMIYGLLRGRINEINKAYKP